MDDPFGEFTDLVSFNQYIGWYDGNVSGPFTRPAVEFAPGAFAYHLHSYSAATLLWAREPMYVVSAKGAKSDVRP